MKVDARSEEAIDAVVTSPEDRFDILVKLSGLNPERDLRAADLSGADFRKSELTDFDFSFANLSGCIWDTKSLKSLKNFRYSLRGSGFPPAGFDVASCLEAMSVESRWYERLERFDELLRVCGLVDIVLEEFSEKGRFDKSNVFKIFALTLLVAGYLEHPKPISIVRRCLSTKNRRLTAKGKHKILYYLFTAQERLKGYHPRFRVPGEIQSMTLYEVVADFLRELPEISDLEYGVGDFERKSALKGFDARRKGYLLEVGSDLL
ncbi:pentapeptide repeat-containing protein [Phaeobacter sp. JH18-32]|uniref:pentapeptide repeat-containing protein n=1 Tax=Phaeobacter TaxID=302485 RepID=UPI003A868C95